MPGGGSARFLPRSAHVTHYWQNKLFMLAGYTYQANSVNDVWSSTDLGLSWKSEGLAAFSGRYWASTTSFGNMVYLAGGAGPSLGSVGSAMDLWQSADSINWTPLSPGGAFVQFRYAAAFVVLNNKLFVAGGTDGNAVFNDVYHLDQSNPSSPFWVAHTPYPGVRNIYSTSVLHGGNLVMVGGIQSDSVDPPVVGEYLTYDGSDWARKDQSPLFPLRFAALASFRGSLLVLGGENENQAFNEVFVSGTEYLSAPSGGGGQPVNSTLSASTNGNGSGFTKTVLVPILVVIVLLLLAVVLCIYLSARRRRTRYKKEDHSALDSTMEAMVRAQNEKDIEAARERKLEKAELKHQSAFDKQMGITGSKALHASVDPKYGSKEENEPLHPVRVYEPSRGVTAIGPQCQWPSGPSESITSQPGGGAPGGPTPMAPPSVVSPAEPPPGEMPAAAGVTPMVPALVRNPMVSIAPVPLETDGSTDEAPPSNRYAPFVVSVDPQGDAYVYNTFKPTEEEGAPAQNVPSVVLTGVNVSQTTSYQYEFNY
jgi:hypothetical protein